MTQIVSRLNPKSRGSSTWATEFQRAGSEAEIKWGPRLGSGAPKGRVPLARPRRDRAMGSSILASLSEAGGNDPLRIVSKPLPPHSQRSADRFVGTRPAHFPLQVRDLNVAPLSNCRCLNSLSLADSYRQPALPVHAGLGIASRHGTRRVTPPEIVRIPRNILTSQQSNILMRNGQHAVYWLQAREAS